VFVGKHELSKRIKPRNRKSYRTAIELALYLSLRSLICILINNKVQKTTNTQNRGSALMRKYYANYCFLNMENQHYAKLLVFLRGQIT
jgi:hypothetical protein